MIETPKNKIPPRYCLDCGYPMKIIQKPTDRVVGYDDTTGGFIRMVDAIMRCPKKNIFSLRHKDINLLWCESLGKWIRKI